MKIAIYTIAKNEERFAEQFMRTCGPADLIVVGDSGSTDRTPQIIKDNGGHVINLGIKPWRFDMARNTVLSVLPSDIDFCFAMDLDERFRDDNWRDMLEKDWQVGTHNRLRFRYVHSFRPDGSPAVVGIKDFAHERHNYFWQHAVHETLYYRGEGQENPLTLVDLVVEHHQDRTKSRTSYLPLLEQECNGRTVTPRHIFWLVREYVGIKAWDKVVTWADKFLAEPGTWYVERSHTLRYKAKALSHLKRHADALACHCLSVDAAPKERECWMDMAWYHYFHDQFPQAYGAVTQALTLTSRPEHYLTSEESWGYKIHELAANCAGRMGLLDKVEGHLKMALRLAPGMAHLKQIGDRYGIKGL